jgi:hypothetical protein
MALSLPVPVMLYPLQFNMTSEAVIFMHVFPPSGDALLGAPARLAVRSYVPGALIIEQLEISVEKDSADSRVKTKIMVSTAKRM